MTLGTDRVRLGFNPSADDLVDQIKQKTADLIDLIDQRRDFGPEGDPADSNPELYRLWSLALTAYEEAAMWAVKAATIAK